MVVPFNIDVLPHTSLLFRLDGSNSWFQARASDSDSILPDVCQITIEDNGPEERVSPRGVFVLAGGLKGSGGESFMMPVPTKEQSQ